MKISISWSFRVACLFATLFPCAAGAVETSLGRVVRDLYSDLPTPYALDTSKNSGAVCVHFLEKVYGGSREFFEISEICKATRVGTNLDQVRDALQKLDLNAAGFTGTTATLKRLRSPAIIRVQLTNEYDVTRQRTKDYFMVVLGWDHEKGRFRVFDPPQEQKEMSFSELDLRFAGTGLLVTRDELESIESGFHPKPPRVPAFVGGGIMGLLLTTLLRRRSSRNAVLMIGLAILPMFGCARQDSTKATDPHLFDVGRVAPGTKISHTFRVYNQSSQPLEYQKIMGDCKCATAMIGDLPLRVEPGDYAEAKVEIDTTEFIGPTERKSMVVTNSKDPLLKMIPLILRFDPVSVTRQVPEVISFGDIDSEQELEELVEIRLTDGEFGDALKSVTCGSPWFTAALSQVRGEWVTLKVGVASGKKPFGTLIGDLVVEFEHADISEPISIPVVARVRGDLQTTPDRVTKSLRTRGARQFQEIRVRSISSRPFKITDVVHPKGFEVATSPDDELAESHVVKLSWQSKELDWSLLEPLIVKTSLAEELHIHLRP